MMGRAATAAPRPSVRHAAKKRSKPTHPVVLLEPIAVLSVRAYGGADDAHGSGDGCVSMHSSRTHASATESWSYDSPKLTRQYAYFHTPISGSGRLLERADPSAAANAATAPILLAGSGLQLDPEAPTGPVAYAASSLAEPADCGGGIDADASRRLLGPAPDDQKGIGCAGCEEESRFAQSDGGAYRTSRQGRMPPPVHELRWFE
jgi:hypothetical protein